MDLITPEQVLGILSKKIDTGGIASDQIQTAIDDFLILHPEYIGATPEQAQQILDNKDNIESILTFLQQQAATIKDIQTENGKTNGCIEDIDNDIKDLQGKITDLENLQSEVNKNSIEIKSLDHRVEANEDVSVKLAQDINTLKDSQLITHTLQANEVLKIQDNPYLYKSEDGAIVIQGVTNNIYISTAIPANINSSIALYRDTEINYYLVPLKDGIIITNNKAEKVDNLPEETEQVQFTVVTIQNTTDYTSTFKQFKNDIKSLEAISNNNKNNITILENQVSDISNTLTSIDDLDKRITQNTSNITGINQNIENINNNITTLQQTDTILQNSIDNIQKNITSNTNAIEETNKKIDGIEQIKDKVTNQYNLSTNDIVKINPPDAVLIHLTNLINFQKFEVFPTSPSRTVKFDTYSIDMKHYFEFYKDNSTNIVYLKAIAGFTIFTSREIEVIENLPDEVNEIPSLYDNDIMNAKTGLFFTNDNTEPEIKALHIPYKSDKKQAMLRINSASNYWCTYGVYMANANTYRVDLISSSFVSGVSESIKNNFINSIKIAPASSVTNELIIGITQNCDCYINRNDAYIADVDSTIFENATTPVIAYVSNIDTSQIEQNNIAINNLTDKLTTLEQNHTTLQVQAKSLSSTVKPICYELEAVRNSSNPVEFTAMEKVDTLAANTRYILNGCFGMTFESQSVNGTYDYNIPISYSFKVGQNSNTSYIIQNEFDGVTRVLISFDYHGQGLMTLKASVYVRNYDTEESKYKDGKFYFTLTAV